MQIMNTRTKNRPTIGILGAGQLGAMLVNSFNSTGCELVVYTQSLDEPACKLVPTVIVGDKNEKSKLSEFFSNCDHVILESEFYSPLLLKELARDHQTELFPSLDSYELLYSKKNQKIFFNNNNVSNVRSMTIKSDRDVEQVDFKAPFMAKLSTGSYDGYGNLLIRDKEDLRGKLQKFSDNFQTPIILEQFVDIVEEFAVMLVKFDEGFEILPPCQTVQKESICVQVNFPMKMVHSVRGQVDEAMKKIANALPGKGLFAFEFFITREGEVLVNEAAPRVHNSYHFSMEAFNLSQFDIVRELVLGRKLKKLEIEHSYASMINILGTRKSESYELKIPVLSGEYHVGTHMYGKKLMKPGRKMGHVTVYGERDVSKIAKHIYEEYTL